MARVKARKPVTSAEGVPVLPRDLVVRPTGDAQVFALFCLDQAAWFRQHGIDPGDWSAVYPVLKASAAVHGIPLASDRARERLRPVS